MPAPSSMLSVLVLIMTLIAVVGFALAIQQVRYMYLQQLSMRIQRSKESVSAGAWVSGTICVSEVRNTGATGVHVKEVKIVLSYKTVYRFGNETHIVTNGYTQTYTDLVLAPFETKIFAFDLLDKVDIPMPEYVESVEITYVSIIVATDKNVFVFNPAPETRSVVLYITKQNIGGTFTIQLPNGGSAIISIYEYLFCSIGPASRTSTIVNKVDATRIYIAKGPDETYIDNGLYSFGYNYGNSSFTNINIDISQTEFQTGNNTVSAIQCSISSPITLNETTITVSRGLILLGTQFSQYDIIALTFAEDPYPKLLGFQGSNELEITNVKRTVFVTKIPLPYKDIKVFEFLATQVTPYIVGDIENDTVINIGNYYSQAILVGEAVSGTLEGGGKDADLIARFNNPYPVIIVIGEPPISIVRD